MKSNKNLSHKIFKVYLNNRHIDTVFYIHGVTKDEVKRSLINHDNYSSNIKIKIGRVKC